MKRSVKKTNKQLGGVIVKTENDAELDGDAEEVYTNGDGLHVQIKEEPQSQEISEEHSDWDTSGCVDTKPDPDTARSDVDLQLGPTKDEYDSDHQSQCELSGAAVKEESESWVKEEDRDSEEEAEDPGKIQGDDEEGEAMCTGRRRSFMKHTRCLVIICYHGVFSDGAKRQRKTHTHCYRCNIALHVVFFMFIIEI